MTYKSSVRQLGADLKATDVTISDQEAAMTILCGLLYWFEYLIVAIDAVSDDEKLTMELVKIRLLQ